MTKLIDQNYTDGSSPCQTVIGRVEAVARISAQERREQLVEAAIRVMSSEGLERATTRRIAEEAGTTQGVFHYAFQDKNELLTAVVAAITLEIEKILHRSVDPKQGLAQAINDAILGVWSYVQRDDGLQLMQYELTIFCRRTEGFEWLAEWQYARYASSTLEIFAASLQDQKINITLPELTNFIVAAVDGLIIQYEVLHDVSRTEKDIGNVVTAACSLAGISPPKRLTFPQYP
ncbi:MAG: TetR/AcrR family transcriptional regulator [Actinomycetota bacterium]